MAQPPGQITQLVSHPVASNVNMQSTYVTLAPGQHVISHNPQPSAVLAGTLVAKPADMVPSTLVRPLASQITTMQPVSAPSAAALPPPQQLQQPALKSTATGSPQHQRHQLQQRPSPGAAGQSRADAVAKVEVLSKQRLQELVKQIDANEQLDEEVEELLLQLADDFIETTVSAACQLAKHRKSSTLDVKDVQLHLERKWNMKIPGFGSDEIRAYKRSGTTEAHKQRIAIIRKALKKY